MFDYDKYVDYLIKVMNEVEKDKLTILTGFNGSGKSLIRKQLGFKLGIKIRSVSMQMRTESNENLGALSTMMHDCSWIATSVSTYDLVKALLDNHSKSKYEVYLVIDEPEIGMSYEVQKAFGNYLRKKVKEVLPNVRGIMVITHSKYVVEALKDEGEFVNLNREYKKVTAGEWLSRVVGDVDLEEELKWTEGLFKTVQRRSKRE